MKRFLTSVSLQHEPKSSDVITLVKKTFFRTSIVRNFISRGVKMRIAAREACVKPHLCTRSDIKIFIPLWYSKRRLSWPVGQWKSEGMLGRILKVEKSEEKRCKNRKKTLLGRLCFFGNGKTRLLFGCLWNAVMKWKWSTATKVRLYSDNGILSPLVHCSTERWTTAYGTQLTTLSVWKYFR